jgi:two-component system, cell cycle sensor histidine kinase and response regulator CckA
MPDPAPIPDHRVAAERRKLPKRRFLVDRRQVPDRRGRTEEPRTPGGAAASAATATPVALPAASEREARLSRTFELAPIALKQLTPDGRPIEVNQRLLDLFGYSREEFLRLLYPDFTHPDDVAADQDGRARLLAGEIPLHRMKKRLVRKDGTVFWGVLTMALVRTATGAPDYFVAAVEDITARKRAEAALEESEERYRSLFELHPDVVVAFDLAGRFTRVNPASEDVAGYRPEELLGRHFAPLIKPEHLERALAHFQATVAGEAQPAIEVAIRHKSGRWVEVSVTSIPIVVHGRVVGVFDMARDLTAQHALEEQLRQAQKLEAVGRLAGGVAHEFNNLLMAILPSAELLLEDTAGRTSREEAEIVHEAAVRAASLTRQLLDFSRLQPVQPQTVNPNTVVRHAARMLRRTIDRTITQALDLEPALGTVLADPGQLEQAVVNLVVNARDAMPHGGRLTIRTRHVIVDEAAAQAHRTLRAGRHEPGMYAPGIYVAIAVEDTGVGIAPELLSRIIEPFFSTKPVGKGSGLGLATVYGIVERWGGWIDIRSAPGEGTTVTLYLPQQVGAPDGEEPEVTQPEPHRTGTVLVVDDEEAVRHSVRRLLTRQGYTVLEAAHGAEALQVLEDRTTPVDLVLTDVVMPLLDGHALIAALKRRAGGPPVIVMSGYDRAAALRGQPLPEDVGFLQKPITSDQLFRSVREALEARP